MKTEVVKIELLKEPEKNVRIHTEKQYEELYRSYKMFGQYRPVVVDENNVVLAGNGFVEALRRNGEKEVTVLRYTNLSDSDKKKLMIADNKTYSLGFDNNDNIMDILAELDDYDVPGFEEDLLQDLLGDQDDVDETIEEFGVLDQEEIAQFERKGERQERRIERAIEEREQQEQEMQTVNYEHETQHQQEDSSESTSTYQPTGEVYTSTKRAVICPHCKGEVVL